MFSRAGSTPQKGHWQGPSPKVVTRAGRGVQTAPSFQKKLVLPPPESVETSSAKSKKNPVRKMHDKAGLFTSDSTFPSSPKTSRFGGSTISSPVKNGTQDNSVRPKAGTRQTHSVTNCDTPRLPRVGGTIRAANTPYKTKKSSGKDNERHVQIDKKVRNGHGHGSKVLTTLETNKTGRNEHSGRKIDGKLKQQQKEASKQTVPNEEYLQEANIQEKRFIDYKQTNDEESRELCVENGLTDVCKENKVTNVDGQGKEKKGIGTESAVNRVSIRRSGEQIKSTQKAQVMSKVERQNGVIGVERRAGSSGKQNSVLRINKQKNQSMQMGSTNKNRISKPDDQKHLKKPVVQSKLKSHREGNKATQSKEGGAEVQTKTSEQKGLKQVDQSKQKISSIQTGLETKERVVETQHRLTKTTGSRKLPEKPKHIVERGKISPGANKKESVAVTKTYRYLVKSSGTKVSSGRDSEGVCPCAEGAHSSGNMEIRIPKSLAATGKPVVLPYRVCSGNLPVCLPLKKNFINIDKSLHKTEINKKLPLSS